MAKKFNIPLSLIAFLGVAFSITLICFWIIRSQYFLEMASIRLAVTLDLTLTLPLVYYLFIRKSNIPKTSLIPVFILCLLIAGILIPQDAHYYLDIIHYLVFPIELFVLVFIIQKTIKIYKGQKNAIASERDFLKALRKVTSTQFSNPILSNILASEISMFYYALSFWNKKKELHPHQIAFTYHKKNGYGAIMIAIALVMIVETLAIHLALMNWSPTLAWVLTALSIYGSIFPLGDYNAIQKRPIYFDSESLHLRIGLRWYAQIPISDIEALEFSKKEIKDSGHANMVLIGSPNILIRFKSPQSAIGLYGLKKRFDSLSFYIDDKEQFKKEFDKMIAAS